MEKYFMIYTAPYGITVEALGEHASIDEAQIHAQTENPEPSHVVDEAELRGLLGSIQNVLT
jgi:hypothetical protein